jgi:D-3-phosphoglycerate dehydrogenase
MRVLVADTLPPSSLRAMDAASLDVRYLPDLSGDALGDAIASSDADVLVVRSTAVTAPMLDRGRLSLIVRAGAGVNTIDVAAASMRGIYVSNCPGANAMAVAELTVGLMLALDRRIPDNVADLRDGRWNKKEYGKARGLHGRTLGLLGFGHIGQEVARRALAFGMTVLVWSRRFHAGGQPLAPDGIGGPITVAGSPRDVASASDVFSLHLALTPETRGLVDASLLDALRPGTLFINTARAELVDYDALAEAVATRGIRAALDVFPGEPAAGTGEYRPPLVDLPGVYGTHHIGASTDQAQEAIAAEAVRVICAYRDTGRVPNVVNLSTSTPVAYRLTIRHRDRPGVLAHVFNHLRADNLNVQEVENVIFDGAEAAVAHITVSGEPSPARLQTMREENDRLALHAVMGHGFGRRLLFCRVPERTPR